MAADRTALAVDQQPNPKIPRKSPPFSPNPPSFSSSKPLTRSSSLPNSHSAPLLSPPPSPKSNSNHSMPPNQSLLGPPPSISRKTPLTNTPNNSTTVDPQIPNNSTLPPSIPSRSSPLPKSNQPPNWSSLFKPNTRTLKQFAQASSIPSQDRKKAQTKVPKSISAEGHERLSAFLLGQFYGKPLPLSKVQHHADLLWGKASKIIVTKLENGSFLFRFLNISVRDWVLQKPLWYMANQPLLLTEWKPGFLPDKPSLLTAPVWVILRGVPLELFTRNGLSYISSVIGDPLFLDRATDELIRVDQAKVCIEVEVAGDLPDTIEVELEDGPTTTVTVEYPWLPPKCGACGEFGHQKSTCPSPRTVRPAKTPVAQDQQNLGISATLNPPPNQSSTSSQSPPPSSPQPPLLDSPAAQPSSNTQTANAKQLSEPTSDPTSALIPNSSDVNPSDSQLTLPPSTKALQPTEVDSPLSTNHVEKLSADQTTKQASDPPNSLSPTSPNLSRPQRQAASYANALFHTLSHTSRKSGRLKGKGPSRA